MKFDTDENLLSSSLLNRGGDVNLSEGRGCGKARSYTNNSPFGRKLFRRLILANPGFVYIQVLLVVFFCYQVYASQVYQFRGEARKHGTQFIINTVGIPIWFVTGFIYEYSIVILGRGLFVRWGGWGFVLAPILHIMVGIHSIFNNEMRVQGYAHDTYFIIYNSLHLIGIGVYFFLLRSNMGLRREMQQMYSCACDCRVDSILPERIQLLIQETNRALDLGLHDSVAPRVKESLCDNGIKHPQFIVEELSKYVSLWSWLPSFISKELSQKLSPKQYRLLSNQLLHNIRILGAHDEETGDQLAELKHRTVPLSASGVTLAVFEKWIKAPIQFALTCTSIAIVASTAPLQATFLGVAIDSINAKDSHGTTVALIAWSSMLFVRSLGVFSASIMQAKLNARVMDIYRKRLLSAIFSAGTEFFDLFLPGSIVDTFTSQMGRVEVILINATWTLLLSVLQLVMGVAFAFRLNYLVGLAFAEMLPVVSCVMSLAVYLYS